MSGRPCRLPHVRGWAVGRRSRVPFSCGSGSAAHPRPTIPRHFIATSTSCYAGLVRVSVGVARAGGCQRIGLAIVGSRALTSADARAGRVSASRASRGQEEAPCSQIFEDQLYQQLEGASASNLNQLVRKSTPLSRTTLWVGGGFYLSSDDPPQGARKPADPPRIWWWDDEARRSPRRPARGADRRPPGVPGNEDAGWQPRPTKQRSQS